MAAQTNIAWADATFNPWMGCTAVSPACDHCYAEARMDTRLHVVKWGAGQPRKRTSAANWREPLKWDRARARAIAAGENPQPHRVFCASLADVFDNEVPDEWRADLFALIRATPHLTWMLLTKRIGNVDKMLAHALIRQPKLIESAAAWPWPNVWIGATICNQEEANRDIPKLLALPAAKRFVSIEPMLGAIKLKMLPHNIGYGSSPCDGCGTTVWRDALDGSTHCESGCDGPIVNYLDWVICGGESGKDARPMHPDWARSLRDQCSAAGTAFFFKQWGQWRPVGPLDSDDDSPEHLAALDCDPHAYPHDAIVTRDGGQWVPEFDGQPPFGCYAMQRRHMEFPDGDIIDGRQWQQFPDTPQGL